MINHPNRSKKNRAVAAAPAKATSRRRPEHNHEVEYPIFEKSIQKALVGAVLECVGAEQTYQTDASGLFDAYLGALGKHSQVHNCHACRRFIEGFGGLVMIGHDGRQYPAMWASDMNLVPEFYRPAVIAMREIVEKAKVIGPFYSREGIYGTPRTGTKDGKTWTHLHAVPTHRYTARAMEPHQAIAAKVQDYQTVRRALADFSPRMLDEAIRILKSGTLSRSERFVAPAEWLRKLHNRPKGKLGDNILWDEVTKAPDGYCHPRSGVIGSLLEDIAAGKPFADIAAAFNAKLDPAIYQRPQAAPSEGNIAQAEKLVERLGIARSLERRFARLDEVRKFWTPQPMREPEREGGVFGHLKGKLSGVKTVDLPTQTMTWVKFAATILPDAERMEIMVPSRGKFIGMTTAVHADAPPILQWDREDDRYPVSNYVYIGGSSHAQWNVRPGYAQVDALAMSPSTRTTVIAIIAGARDTFNKAGLALFPETLKSELHGARATIEAHSNGGKLAGAEEATACGLAFGAGSPAVLRVLTRGVWTAYHIDRWD